jgi:hypothetical protein
MAVGRPISARDRVAHESVGDGRVVSSETEQHIGEERLPREEKKADRGSSPPASDDLLRQRQGEGKSGKGGGGSVEGFLPSHPRWTMQGAFLLVHQPKADI